MDLFFDIETRSTVDLRKCGADVYANAESTELLCLAWCMDDQPMKIWTFEESVEGLMAFWMDLDRADRIIAHNAAFERTIMNVQARRHLCYIPEIPLEKLFCTMALCYYYALPGSLENAAAACGLHFKKNKEGHRIMLQLSKPRSAGDYGSPIWWDPTDTYKTKSQKYSPREKYDLLYRYCMDDVEVTRELWNRLPKLPQDEADLWRLDRRINERGVPIDIPSCYGALAIVEEEKERLDQEMRDVSGDKIATTGAVRDIVRFVQDRGVPVDSIAKQSIVDLLERDDLPLEVVKVLKLRQLASKTSTAKIDAMIAASRGERVRDTLQYHAASTGRWGGRRIQPQNLPRPTISQQEIEEVIAVLQEVSR